MFDVAWAEQKSLVNIHLHKLIQVEYHKEVRVITRLIKYQYTAFLGIQIFLILEIRCAGDRLCIIMSYKYRNSHYKDKALWLPSHLGNGLTNSKITINVRHTNPSMTKKTTNFTHRIGFSLALLMFCRWRHNRLLVTSLLPDTCRATYTRRWKVIPV